ncbi:unnamed protein product [Amoebophrya sp. A25]|nr:unnamed protein product [Amoebophrya sp. A25]|eukprot:GSA25T00022285001.1
MLQSRFSSSAALIQGRCSLSSRFSSSSSRNLTSCCGRSVSYYTSNQRPPAPASIFTVGGTTFSSQCRFLSSIQSSSSTFLPAVVSKSTSSGVGLSLPKHSSSFCLHKGCGINSTTSGSSVEQNKIFASSTRAAFLPLGGTAAAVVLQKRGFFSAWCKSKSPEVVQCEETKKTGSMAQYDYDFFVLGGGSGGLAAAKRAGGLGKRTAVADYVEPSPAGTTWGLGGTCLNVGCIPKKLCHFAAQAPEFQQDFAALGWEFQAKHNWEQMIQSINNYIKGSNWGNKTDLKHKDVKYYNKYATFVDAHTIQLRDKKGAVETVTADKIMISVGGRPNYGGYPGVEECCISSDDIFWQKKPPGKTLVVGASYIALECAGFIASLGFDTTVMVRSILLRGFDRDMADMIGGYMQDHGVKFANGMVPSKFEKNGDKTKVFVNDEEFGEYDTVLMAIGRTGLATKLNLEAAGVNFDAKNGKIPVDSLDKTNVDNIFAIGDIALGRLELTPVAIQSGRLLVDRLFDNSKKPMDYQNVATTVFTPIEFGTVGLSEDDAIAQYGKDNLTIYHGYFHPLEWRCNHERPKAACYMKYICDPAKGDKIIGMHVLGPNSGEMIQGFAVALKCGMTREMLNDTVGIHPTCAESMCDLQEVKKEGIVLDGPAGC